MYKRIIRPVLFLLDPEMVHRLICAILKLPLVPLIVKWIFSGREISRQTAFCGLIFSNPVGLAAGFDKDGELTDQLAVLGYGFVEIGTVTPLPQPGNEKPRLFRLPKDEALINRMGFNNAGVEQVRANLLKSKRKCIIGVNIGKNKNTPNTQAVNDYAICFSRLHDVADYFVVNVSSPNTPGLRELQDKEALTELLSHLQSLNRAEEKQKPVFLKIAPDLSNVQLDDIISVVLDTGIAGIIATNTTVNRDHISSDNRRIEQIGSGGLSGKPLKDRATEVIRYLSSKSAGTIPIIGVGGILSARDAREKIAAGAALVQLYTGFIYEGPSIIKKILKQI
jgi:dihydroorotate dehydrogenase